ncbi:MAG: hypothetical protein K0Q83_1054 [Deltaproteobacteria bacterium]|nr:hypothetical protein [Deltaproteobacteria bacterium]
MYPLKSSAVLNLQNDFKGAEILIATVRAQVNRIVRQDPLKRNFAGGHRCRVHRYQFTAAGAKSADDGGSRRIVQSVRRDKVSGGDLSIAFELMRIGR